MKAAVKALRRGRPAQWKPTQRGVDKIAIKFASFHKFIYGRHKTKDEKKYAEMRRKQSELKTVRRYPENSLR